MTSWMNHRPMNSFPLRMRNAILVGPSHIQYGAHHWEGKQDGKLGWWEQLGGFRKLMVCCRPFLRSRYWASVRQPLILPAFRFKYLRNYLDYVLFYLFFLSHCRICTMNRATVSAVPNLTPTPSKVQWPVIIKLCDTLSSKILLIWMLQISAGELGLSRLGLMKFWGHSCLHEFTLCSVNLDSRSLDDSW